jgi:hypothetical protein
VSRRAACVVFACAAAFGLRAQQSGALDRPPDLAPGRTLPKVESAPSDLPEAVASPPSVSAEDRSLENAFAADSERRRAADARRPSRDERRFGATAAFVVAAALVTVAFARAMLRARRP